MEILYIIALLLLLFTTFTGRLKRFTVFFSIVVILLLNYGLENNLDLYNYFNRYNNIMNIESSREIGFQIIMKFFNLFNIDFATFRCIMIIIALSYIILYLKKITKDISFFMLLYMSYFAFMDAEQLRNFYALIVLICAFKYLFYNEKNSNIKYIILILIASSIHSSFIVYLLLIIVKSNINISKLLLKAIPIMVVIMLVLARYTNMQSTILGLFSTEEDTRATYYSQASSNLGWIIPATIYIFNIFVIKYCCSVVKDKELFYKINKYSLKDAKIIKKTNIISISYVFERLYWINIIALIFLPLYMNSLVFYRMNRNIVMINLLFITSLYNKLRETKKKSLIIFILSFLVILGYCIFDFSIYYSWEHFYNVYFVERSSNSLI